MQRHLFHTNRWSPGIEPGPPKLQSLVLPTHPSTTPEKATGLWAFPFNFSTALKGFDISLAFDIGQSFNLQQTTNILYTTYNKNTTCIDRENALGQILVIGETAPDRDGLIWVSVVRLSNDMSGRKQGG
jgi:hypothetical protein